MLILTNHLHFLTAFIWDALINVNVSRTKSFLMNTETCSNHEVLAGATEKLLVWEKLHAKTVAWSYDMEGHARKCLEIYCELANKKVEQLQKVSSLCLDDHQFKKEQLEPVGDLSQVRSQIVLICLYLARIGRPDICMVCQKT